MDFLKKKIVKASAKIEAGAAAYQTYEQQKALSKQQQGTAVQPDEDDDDEYDESGGATRQVYGDDDGQEVTQQADGTYEDDEEDDDEADEDADGFPNDLGKGELHDGGTIFTKRLMHNIFHDEDDEVDPEDLEHDTVDEDVRLTASSCRLDGS